MKTPTQLPSQKRLNEVFAYNPETGELTWKVKHARCIKVGSIAGCSRSDGYRVVSFEKTQYLQHRIIWKMIYGAEPEQIDHKDRNPSNNKLDNLRASDSQSNQGNRRQKGVHFCNRAKKYIAKVSYGNKPIYVGSFDCPLIAHLAYQDKHKELHKEYSPYCK